MRDLLTWLLLSVAIAADASDDVDVIKVEYGNCQTVVAGPVCVLPVDGRITLWVGAPPGATIIVRAGGDEADVVQTATDRLGVRLQVEVPPDTRRVAVDVDGNEVWHIATNQEPTAEYGISIDGLIAAREFDRARRELDRLLSVEPSWRHGALLGLLARIELRQDERDAAYATLGKAIENSLAHGRHLEALRHTNVLAYLLINEYRRFDEVAIAYARVQLPTGAPAEALYFRAYNTGWAASDAGNSRIALRSLSLAAEQAARMGWSRRQLHADGAMANELLNLGRRDDALALLEPWRERGLPPGLSECERGDFYNNLGWAALLGLEAGEVVDDPTEVLDQARAIYDANCPLNYRSNVRINLALAHYHAGRTQLAQASLDDIDVLQSSIEPRLQLWYLDLSARLALRRGETEAAQEAVDLLGQLARDTASPSARWRAAIARATLYRSTGQIDDAVEAYREAEYSVDADIRRIGLFDGRETLLAARARAAMDHLALLLALDHRREAFELVRTTRRRVLAALDAPRIQQPGVDQLREQYRELREALEQDYLRSRRLPADEQARLRAKNQDTERQLQARLDEALARQTSANDVLPDSLPGELMLVFARVENAWVGFAQYNDQLWARYPVCAGERSDTALASCLIEQFRESLVTAARLVLVLPASLDTVDFHAVTLAGERLVEHLPIVYSLDLGARSDTESRTGSALVVADTRGNLPGARRELENVATLLEASGNWSVQRLAGRRAPAAAVREALTSATLFHYAGHAQFAGRGGWDSELQLSRGSSLDVADILALPAVPLNVVLSGCDTATTEDTQFVASMGIAQAFLARGSAFVIATTRPVADVTADALMQSYYAAWRQGDAPADALRQAQRQLLAQKPEADWSAFRLLTR